MPEHGDGGQALADSGKLDLFFIILYNDFIFKKEVNNEKRSNVWFKKI